MNEQECCNHDCNQGRDCPLRKETLDTRSYLMGRYDAIKTDNEPVAWIDPFDLERLPHHDCWVNGQEHKNSVPLYTHPAKTLTDEEIQEVINDPQFATIFELEDFAKAILKKAQGK